jgi:hypothetical protein
VAKGAISTRYTSMRTHPRILDMDSMQPPSPSVIMITTKEDHTKSTRQDPLSPKVVTAHLLHLLGAGRPTSVELLLLPQVGLHHRQVLRAEALCTGERSTGHLLMPIAMTISMHICLISIPSSISTTSVVPSVIMTRTTKDRLRSLSSHHCPHLVRARVECAYEPEAPRSPESVG